MHEFDRGQSKRARPMGPPMMSQGGSRPRMFPRPPRPSFSHSVAGSYSQSRGFRGGSAGQSSGFTDHRQQVFLVSSVSTAGVFT